MRTTGLIIIALLSGCAEFPELDGTVDDAARNAPFPELVNLDALRGQVGASDATPDNMAARIAGLNARADALRQR